MATIMGTPQTDHLALAAQSWQLYFEEVSHGVILDRRYESLSPTVVRIFIVLWRRRSISIASDRVSGFTGQFNRNIIADFFFFVS